MGGEWKWRARDGGVRSYESRRTQVCPLIMVQFVMSSLGKCSERLTLDHEVWLSKHRLCAFVQRRKGRICYRIALEHDTDLLGHVEVVCKCYAVAGGHWQHLVLAVGIESCPLDRSSVCIAPIKVLGVTFVRDTQLTSFMRVWKTNEGAELSFSPRCVNMGFELACWA